MVGRVRSQASQVVRLIAVLAIFVTFLTPMTASSAQAPAASPVVESTPTPSPEVTAEPTEEPAVTPTATSESTTTTESTPPAESEFGAVSIGSVTFDQSTYNVGSGVSTLVTIRVNTVGVTNLGFRLSSSGIVTFGPMSENSFGTHCVPALEDGVSIEGTVVSTFSNNNYCEILVIIYADSSNPPGTEGSLTFSTGPVGGPYAENATANVSVVAAPVIELSLSDDTPGLDDIVTVTSVLTIDTSTTETMSATVLATIPNGVTLISSSASAECIPACPSPLVDENQPTVRAIVSIPPSANAPLTVSLTFQVQIDSGTTPGTILEFWAYGEAQGTNATPANASLTVTVAPTLVLDLGSFTASPGDEVEVFAILSNPASPSTISREELSVALPDGLTLIPSSGWMQCDPDSCIDLADPTGTDPIVGFGDYPAGSVGPLTTYLSFAVTVDPDIAIGTLLTLTGSGSSAGVASNPDDVTLEIVPPPDAPELAVSLSDSNPDRGDIITVTVTLTSSTDAISASRERFDSQLPVGTQLVGGSLTVVCNPNVCGNGSNDSGPQFVGGHREYPFNTAVPFVTTFTYQLLIQNTAAMGVPLTIQTTGSSFYISAPPVSSSIIVPPDTDVVATDGTLEVPLDGGKNAQLAAIGGSGVYQFSLDTQATKGIAQVSENGAYSFIAFDGESGADQFTFTVTDGFSTDTGTITIMIGPPPPTATSTSTPTEVPPTATSTSTPTEVPPTATATSTSTPTEVPPTATSTSTPTEIPPTATATSTSTPTEVPPTATSTSTPTEVPPTATETSTSTPTEIPPTATETSTSTPTEVPPTATETSTSTPTEVPPTATSTSTPTEVPPTATIPPGEPGPLVAQTLTLNVDSGGTSTGNLADQVSGGIPPYTFLLITAPTKGQVTISTEGLFTYTANEGESGPDSFTYSVTDSQAEPQAAAVVTGEVTLVIAAQIPSPTPTVDPGSPIAPDPTASATSPINQLPSTGTGSSGSLNTVFGFLIVGMILLSAAIWAGRRRHQS